MLNFLIVGCCVLARIIPVVSGLESHQFEDCHKNGTMGCQARSRAEHHREVKNIRPEVLVSNDPLRDTDRLEDSFNPWYTKLPLLPIVYATSKTLPDGACKRKAQLYLDHLKNGTLWAVQMYDASAKYPYGLISGHTRDLGDFDGCYDLRVKLQQHEDNRNTDRDEEIAGKYCLVDFRYEKRGLPPLKSNERHDLEFDPNESIWEAIREKGDFRRVKRYLLQMALCVPDACTIEDIKAALQGPLDDFSHKHDLDFEISIKPHFCQVKKEPEKFSTGAKIYCFVLAGLVLLAVAGTCYDFITIKDYPDDGTSTTFNQKLILCFSARRHLKSLMEPPTSKRAFETFHLMRFFFTTLVILGHRTIQYFTGPMINSLYLERVYKYQTSMLLFGGTVTVDAFFGISGFILSYQILGYFGSRKKINFLGLIVTRFIRLIPSYMIIVFFLAFLLPHFGSGPFWAWKVSLESESCRDNWWTNLLFINNYVNPERVCMIQSWYLAIDYHLHIIALFVIYLFSQMPRKLGYSFLVVVIIASAAVPFINTYYYGVQPLYKGLLYMQEVRYDPYYVDHYIKSHERLMSYFIGVVGGAIIYDHERKPWRLGSVVSNILFILLVVVISLSSELLGHTFLDPNTKPTVFYAATYAALHRGAFAFAFAALPVLVTVGDGLDFHYNFMAPRWVRPLAKLTYGTYLIHNIHQIYHVGVTRAPKTFTLFNMLWDYIPDVVVSFFLALLLLLIVEGPFRSIEKLVTAKRADKSVACSNTQNTHEADKKKD